jgi:predicted nucleic acid-binding protein
MPETEKLVINTGPLLALIAGIGDLSLLELLYKRVLVPFEVCQEIEAVRNALDLDFYKEKANLVQKSYRVDIMRFDLIN